eukprot:s684_g9.t1
MHLIILIEFFTTLQQQLLQLVLFDTVLHGGAPGHTNWKTAVMQLLVPPLGFTRPCCLTGKGALAFKQGQTKT